MLILIFFAFIAGIVTILSPCILPILPLILSSSVGNSGKSQPIGVVTGFIASFTFFTLFLSTIVRVTGISADALRIFSILVLAVFGFSLLIPQVQAWVERAFSTLAARVPSTQQKQGFFGGVLVGLSLGLLWTPCVGPILAAVITLALSGTVSTQAALITLAYAVGTAIPMLGIMFAGARALQKVPWLLAHAAAIQKAFGVVMIITAVAIAFNVDRQFQTWVIQTFPSYGTGLTKLEDNQWVRQALQRITATQPADGIQGQPLAPTTKTKGPQAPEIAASGEWFNSAPLTLAGLKGRVVLLDFWTYSCINCIRTLPYLKQWWQQYQDDGLVIIGVHAPEFEFEKNAANVATAISDFGIEYPVFQDNDFKTWRAYRNQYWPAKYLIDKDGQIRYTHFGEGDYDETEQTIQALLKETNAQLIVEPPANPDYQVYARTPEIYLGYKRIQYLDGVDTIRRDTQASYTLPERLSPHTYGLDGEWTIMPEYAAPAAGAALELEFEAKEVFIVARPKAPGATMTVTVDGQSQAPAADVQQGVVSVDADRLYKLVLLEQPGRHTLRLEFDNENIELYAFTFG